MREKVWEKIFYIKEKLHDSCDRLQDPELDKQFNELTVAQFEAVKKVKLLTDGDSEGISLKTLAEELNISAAATSELVDILVKKGWLVREQSRVDRRAVCIKLSERTKSAVKNLHNYFDEVTEDFIGHVGEDKAGQLSEMLDEFIKIIEV